MKTIKGSKGFKTFLGKAPAYAQNKGKVTIILEREDGAKKTVEVSPEYLTKLRCQEED